MKKMLQTAGAWCVKTARDTARGFLSRWQYFLIILGVIGADQLTKRLAVAFLEPIPTKPLIEDVLHLTYLENRGAAFGMLSDHRAVFMILSTVGILAFWIFLLAKPKRDLLFDIGLSMVIGGGIGNMIDRIAFGYVVDFIDFRLIHFAVFNGADSFVCVGAALIVLAFLLEIIREEKEKKTSGGDGHDADGIV